MSIKIPLLDLSTETEALWDELNAAIQRVLRSGQFIMGPEVPLFEKAVADYLQVKHAVAVNSGTDALVIGLKALGVGPGDEVITTPFSFFATAESISMVGARPVFVDIDPRTFNIDARLIEAAITPRTKAILPVHLYGQAANMETIVDLAAAYKLPILEDVAQAFGGKYKGQMLGTLGVAGAFSFFPSKNLGAYGDAGLLVTNDDQIAEKARMLRTHGSRTKYANEILGYNSRMDTIQAAILHVKLAYVDAWNARRRQIAHLYDELLGDLPGVVTPFQDPNAEHVYHQYTVRIANGSRDVVRAHLTEAGVGSAVYYPVPIHRLPVYADLGYVLPVSEAASREVLSLPIWPQMTSETQKLVAAAVRDALL